MPSRQYKARAKRRAKYLQKREEILKERSSEESKEKARERYHQNSDHKQTAEWEKYHKNPEPILSLKRQRYNEKKAVMNSAEHRDDSIASPAKRMRLQERPTDQHAALSNCYPQGNEISTNKPQRYVRIRLSDTILILGWMNVYMYACIIIGNCSIMIFINLCVAWFGDVCN